MKKIIVRGLPADFQEQIETTLTWIKTLEDFRNKNVEGVHVVFDAVACDYFNSMYNTMTRGGKYVIYGAAQYMESCKNAPNYIGLAWKYLWRTKLDPMQMVTENKSVLGFNLIWMWDQLELMNAMLEDMFESQNEWFTPLVGHKFPFSEALDALHLLQSGTTLGKVILEI
jgi:alcohol dehydrogenase